MPNPSKKSGLKILEELVTELRDPEKGCPWILAQTLQSLAALTIEESYELADSIDQGDDAAILDELSDVLLHLMLYAQLGKERAHFDLNTIALKAVDKQFRRKPVFHKNAVKTAKQALAQWEENKRKERLAKNPENDISMLDSIIHTLPALNRAYKLQTQAASVGFDWPSIKEVLAKLSEEINELNIEIQNSLTKNSNAKRILEEMGDILFTCVNLARHLQIDPETALRQANNKFERRFRKLEKHFQSKQKSLHDCSLTAMDQIWDELKKHESD